MATGGDASRPKDVGVAASADRSVGLDDEDSVPSPFQEALSLDQQNEHFRVASLGRDFASGTFSGASLDLPTSLTPRYRAYTKLEVINALRVNSMALTFNIVVAVSICASIISVVLSRTLFARIYNIPGLPNNLLVYVVPYSFSVVESTLSFAVFAYSITLCMGYLVLLLLYKDRNVSNEQVWVFLLLFSIFVYLNPYEAIVRIRRDGLFASGMGSGPTIATTIAECCRIVSFSFASILYVWMSSHSYRLLTVDVTWRDWTFYVPKVACVLVYDVYKLVFLFRYGIVFSELPFASIVGCAQLYSTIGLWPKLGVVSVSILTLMEVAMAICVGYDMYKTGRLHATVDYTKYRTKRLGFRFFAHQHLVFYFAFALIYATILFGFPIGIQVLYFFVRDALSGRSYFDIHHAPFGLQICILAYATIEAYVALPARATIMPCVGPLTKPQTKLEHEIEPISYRNREPASFSEESITSRPNCFTMQTHIKLFNLAWFIYYYGTSKENRLHLDLSSSRLNVKKFINDEGTDTRVIIMEGADRICIAFKGTSSSRNLSTDVKVVQTALRHVIPSQRINASNRYSDVSQYMRTWTYRRAKVHVGFAHAYESVCDAIVSEVRALVRAKKRPVLLCGHSLGGALATLCSLDLTLQEWWQAEGEGVLVSTFGSPRVGNRAFRDVYDSMVCTHWRVVAGGDVIARLPSVGYSHVGRKITLTASGELFMDADALEVRLWHRQAASLVHHRKACYLLALRGWCERYHGRDYVDEFWDFPVSKDDSRRFHEAFSKRSNVGLIDSSTESVRNARLKVWADAIDLLGPQSERDVDVASVGSDNVRSMRAIASWAHMTRPILQIIRGNGGNRQRVDAIDNDLASS